MSVRAHAQAGSDAPSEFQVCVKRIVAVAELATEELGAEDAKDEKEENRDGRERGHRGDRREERRAGYL